MNTILLIYLLVGFGIGLARIIYIFCYRKLDTDESDILFIVACWLPLLLIYVLAIIAKATVKLTVLVKKMKTKLIKKITTWKTRLSKWKTRLSKWKKSTRLSWRP